MKLPKIMSLTPGIIKIYYGKCKRSRYQKNIQSRDTGNIGGTGYKTKKKEKDKKKKDTTEN